MVVWDCRNLYYVPTNTVRLSGVSGSTSACMHVESTDYYPSSLNTTWLCSRLYLVATKCNKYNFLNPSWHENWLPIQKLKINIISMQQFHFVSSWDKDIFLAKLQEATLMRWSCDAMLLHLLHLLMSHSPLTLTSCHAGHICSPITKVAKQDCFRGVRSLKMQGLASVWHIFIG